MATRTPRVVRGRLVACLQYSGGYQHQRQEGLRARERQAELVARGASRTMPSRHLTGHAVDLVALDGEVRRQWEDYFRVAAAMHAAAPEARGAGVLGWLLGLALGDRVPEDSVGDYVAACRATGQKAFLEGPHFGLSRACRHDRLDQDRAGGSPRSSPRFSRPWSPGGTSACRASRPRWGRFTPGSRLEQFNRDTRLLVPDQAWWSSNPLDMLRPEMDVAFVMSGEEAAAADRGAPPVVIIAVR